MLYPAFLSRNRMVIRVLAKTTKVKKNLLMERNRCFFLYTTMVFAAVRTHFPRKNTRIYRNTVTCVTRVTSNRVEVHRFNSQHLAMVRTSNIAELVPSSIFCLQPWLMQRSEHISQRKTPVYMSIELRSINSCLRTVLPNTEVFLQRL